MSSNGPDQLVAFFNSLRRNLTAPAKKRVFSRNDFLTREGQIEHFIYYIESGAVRMLFLTELEEHTIRLGYTGTFINSLDSFMSGQPSRFYLQALRKTTVQAIPKSEFMDFVYSDPEIKDQYLRLLEITFIQQMDREIDLLTFSPQERVQRVLDRSPQVFQEVPAKYIASYLRMTPETLSRILKS